MSFPPTERHLSDPYFTYSNLLNNSPIFRDEQLNAWLVFDYSLVKRLLNTNSLSAKRNKLSNLSEDQQARYSILKSFYNMWLMYEDPPIHTEMRSFATKFMKTQQELIEAEALNSQILIVYRDLEREADTIEFTQQYSNKVSAIVIAHLFKIDAFNVSSLLFQSECIVELLGQGSVSEESLEASQQALVKVFHFLEANMNITELASFMQPVINYKTALAILTNIFLDGYKSISTLISNIIYNLLSNQQLQQNLCCRNVDSKMVEELIRFDPPFQYISRIANSDFTVENHNISQGDKFLLFIAAANRDPKLFEAPDNIMVEREINPHLSFGYGTHYCIGASMVRRVLDLILNPLLTKLDSIRLADTVEWEKSIGYRSLKRLPLKIALLQ
ncbi:MAG: cytochrome P450 [Bacteroidota bacterium]